MKSKPNRFISGPGDMQIVDPEKEKQIDKAIKEIVKSYVSDKRNKQNVK